VDKAVRDYVVAMEFSMMLNTFDGGQSLTLERKEADGRTTRLRDSYYWGDEDRFNRRVRQWLDSQPWPREDDPRASMEGTYEDRRA
jgi:hypothetical protein